MTFPTEVYSSYDLLATIVVTERPRVDFSGRVDTVCDVVVYASDGALIGGRLGRSRLSAELHIREYQRRNWSAYAAKTQTQ